LSQGNAMNFLTVVLIGAVLGALEGVIECVDRGVPNRLGKKGKPTMWRYKLPLD